MGTKTGQFTLQPHPRFGFQQIHPTPSPDEITRFYAEEFYSGDYKRFNDSSLEVQLEDPEFYQDHFRDIIHGVKAALGGDLDGRAVLDIGCGWGQALTAFRDAGLVPHGFDPAPEAVAHGRRHGLDVIEAGMETMAPFAPKRFDVVTMLNVLEHLADPVHVLQEIADAVIAPGGVIVIDVPNEFNPWQLAGRDTHGLEDWWVAPPGHLNYFSKETLKNVLEGTGFEAVRFEASFPMELFLLLGHDYVSDPVLGRSCHRQRVTFERNLRDHAGDAELRRFYEALGRLGLGRQILAFARKPA